ncbi:putative esterase [Variibacter gotjawalensis]|uniref:Putative esterase n=1 Tax=Variibacter gotjawalensis TaxID=1333996 RepID=A0A0S3PYF9_9BRAD|nr:PaaI family thioesterase [Variibacter gotjawalensis]NIK46821.1 uncharacterized protein (TIGR00369 family) [Variibacter gotjawalensis]RZS48725.1 uncharacterized protein (TIGR00369 family) [Variibacter gotjawalensis]BAT60984.1 putative esterase [Variibacter gotjawalensis]
MPIETDGSLAPDIITRFETDPHKAFTHIGARITYMSRECIRAELPVHPGVENRDGSLHGGTIMAIGDHIGAVATILNSPPGKGTTTVESKTNFFARIPPGDIALAECTPLHRGRTTQVWETRIKRRDGKLCAITVQTQLVIDREV